MKGCYIYEFKIFHKFRWLYWTVKARAKKKSLKILMLSFTIFKGISELWDTLFTFWFKIKCSTSFLSTLVKLKQVLFLSWFLIATIFGWFHYFRIVSYLNPWYYVKKFVIWISCNVKILDYVWIKSFGNSAACSSVMISSPFSFKWISLLTTIFSENSLTM